MTPINIDFELEFFSFENQAGFEKFIIIILNDNLVLQRDETPERKSFLEV